VADEAASMALGLFILVQERTFADALAIRLEREPDMDVVVALDISKPPRVFAGSRVNVVLLDADLPDNAAFGMSQELSQAPGAPHVILLSYSDDPERIVRGLRAGAVGWVRKDASLARLIDVIRGVARGETWLPPDQTEEISRLLGRRPGHDEDGGDSCSWSLWGMIPVTGWPDRRSTVHWPAGMPSPRNCSQTAYAP
jgi:DNA-binding NarL/FixJ family response regulator